MGNAFLSVSHTYFSKAITYEVGPLYFILAFALFLLLVLVIGFCVWKNRSLSHKYTQLETSRRGTRTTDLEDAEDTQL